MELRRLMSAPAPMFSLVSLLAGACHDQGPDAASGPTFAAVSAGGDHTCGVTPAGEAYCWGSNSVGQLGDGTTMNRTRPVAVLGGLTFSAVSAGFGHTCGITTGGAAYCWGKNSSGQLGIGDSAGSVECVSRCHSVPQAVLGGLSFTKLSAGGNQNCGLTTDGAAYCWGEISGNAEPQPLTGRSFPTVSVGVDHTCGLTTAGEAYCWGANDAGQLGHGTLDPTTAPVAVLGGFTFSAVSAGYLYTCGVTVEGAGYCWGRGQLGQLGDGGSDYRTSPVAVLGGLTFAGVSAGGGNHTCGVAAAGEAYCWGNNRAGQLGDGTTSDDRTSPVAVLGGLKFASVTAGDAHSCGITTDHATYCWGRNLEGQLGNGTTTNSSVPVKVASAP